MRRQPSFPGGFMSRRLTKAPRMRGDCVSNLTRATSSGRILWRALRLRFLSTLRNTVKVDDATPNATIAARRSNRFLIN